MSKDIIYREDAINLLWYFQDECCSAVVGDFEKLPSADRPQEWIPCSERLPNKSGKYLVTIIQNESSFQQGVTNIFIRSLVPANVLYGEGFGKQLTWRQELWEDVVAWMPLPEPWKGADDE